MVRVGEVTKEDAAEMVLEAIWEGHAIRVLVEPIEGIHENVPNGYYLNMRSDDLQHSEDYYRGEVAGLIAGYNIAMRAASARIHRLATSVLLELE
jgi:hypothetical protein